MKTLFKFSTVVILENLSNTHQYGQVNMIKEMRRANVAARDKNNCFRKAANWAR